MAAKKKGASASRSNAEKLKIAIKPTPRPRISSTSTSARQRSALGDTTAAVLNNTTATVDINNTTVTVTTAAATLNNTTATVDINNTTTTATTAAATLNNTTATATDDVDVNDTTATVNNTNLSSINDLRAQLQKAQEENEGLKQENEKNRHTANRQTARIPRPSGAVSNWKLQEAMQLTGSTQMSEIYAGIQRVVVEAVWASPINWSSPWNKIPPNLKADLYATVRSKVEGLERYEQDWATEGLARQYLKNRRSYNYRQGRLDVPENYQYLKDNAAKRSNTPCGNTHKRKAAEEKREATVTKRARISKGKEKAISNSDEEEDSDHEGQGDDLDED